MNESLGIFKVWRCFKFFGISRKHGDPSSRCIQTSRKHLWRKPMIHLIAFCTKCEVFYNFANFLFEWNELMIVSTCLFFKQLWSCKRLGGRRSDDILICKTCFYTQKQRIDLSKIFMSCFKNEFFCY